MQIAKNVKRLKKVHDLTNTELANQLGVSRRTIGRLLEAADTKYTDYYPTDNTVGNIASFFSISPTDVRKRLPAFLIETAI